MGLSYERCKGFMSSGTAADNSKAEISNGYSGAANTDETPISGKIVSKSFGTSIVKAQGITNLAGQVRVCSTLEEWLRPECERYKALHVARPPLWSDIQQHVEALAASNALGANEAVEDEVCVPSGDSWERRFLEDLRMKAHKMVSVLTAAGFPSAIADTIETDCVHMAFIVAKMVSTEKVLIKLNVMGENCCSKWHQDFYTGRGIVSYNLVGTQFLDDANVNFWEMENCSNNDHACRDESKIYQAKPGDFLFMKGATFPSLTSGLIHRSPPKQYDADGACLNRLLLKVDVP